MRIKNANQKQILELLKQIEALKKEDNGRKSCVELKVDEIARNFEDKIDMKLSSLSEQINVSCGNKPKKRASN